MAKRYDVIVVGAGPAGLMAAKTAAEDGLKVLIIERKKDVTEVQRLCGRLTAISLINMSGKLKYGYTEPLHFEIGTDKNMVHFPRLGFSIDYEGPLRPYLNYMYFSPSGYHVYREKNRLFAFSWEKESLLASLLSSALKAGAEILTETIATRAENTSDGAKVFVRGKSGEQTLEAKKAIAADGSSSRIVDSLGLNEKRRVLGRGGAGGVGYVLEGIESEFRLNTWINFAVPDIGRGNFYMFMMSGDMNVLGGGAAGSEGIEKFMRLPYYERWFRHARVVNKVAASMASGPRTPLWEPVAGNVLAIGDAAALVEVTNPGAIACGYLGAKTTLKELNGQSAYPEYIAWWQKAFDTNDPGYLKAAGRNFIINAICGNEEIDYLFHLIQDQMGVPAILIARNMERIKNERPELYAKLKEAGMSENIDEVKMDLGQTLERRKSYI